MTDRAGDVLAGRYELVEPLGSGGFGSVFRANDLIEDREVALKVLDPRLDISFVRREFLPLQRFDHPNIVKAYQPAEAAGGRWVIPFELVEGSNVRERVEKDGPLGLDALRELGSQLLAALSTIHPDEARIAELQQRGEEGTLEADQFELLSELRERGLVHRDVKPDNVLIRADGNVVLVDFGISSRAGTRALTSRGTHEYWPPDLAVVALDRWDPDVDRYAAGATLFVAACGALPYDGVDRQTEVADPLTYRSSLPSKVCEFLVTACAPSREERFASTDAMADAWTAAWTERTPAVADVAPFVAWPVDERWGYYELDDEELRGLVLNIVRAEGPILCRRLYTLIAAAIGERPTARLNRLVYRMVSEWDGPLSQIEPLGNGQQDKTVYVAGTDPHMMRTLGERELWDLPWVELATHRAHARRALGLADESDGDPEEIAALVAQSLAPSASSADQKELATFVASWLARRRL